MPLEEHVSGFLICSPTFIGKCWKILKNDLQNCPFELPAQQDWIGCAGRLVILCISSKIHDKDMEKEANLLKNPMK